jgi:hypothetical protein
MFGHKHLLRNGTPARAVVTAATPHGGHSDGHGTNPLSFDLDLRVQFEGGSTGDVRCHVGGFIHGTDQWFTVGDIVPVRYDAADRTKVVVDEAAMSTAAQAEAATRDADAVARAQAELASED